MEPGRPSLLKRALAILVLLIVAAVAIRLVVGIVAGVITAVLWIVVVALLVGAALWARSTLRSTKRRRAVEPSSRPGDLAAAPHEDLVAAEMQRITEQLREQGRR